jgi:hypothetical protein
MKMRENAKWEMGNGKREKLQYSTLGDRNLCRTVMLYQVRRIE